MKPHLHILLASPRGFCAGVERAVAIVELALQKHTPPVYVRHQIVHNAHVVRRLEKLGAVFVPDVHHIPDGANAVISAHGAPKSAFILAKQKNLNLLDATCPLVHKVHAQAVQHHKNGRRVILVGHKNHPEIIGTLGQLPKNAALLVETENDVLNLPNLPSVAYATQTTLSIDDAAHIVRALKRRYPHIVDPPSDNICYATTNRQLAVQALAPKCERLFVIGAQNSSNSLRLVEVAAQYGNPLPSLLCNPSSINWSDFGSPKTLGITASASAPEILVQQTIDAMRSRFRVTIEHVQTTVENVQFHPPKSLLKRS